MLLVRAAIHIELRGAEDDRGYIVRDVISLGCTQHGTHRSAVGGLLLAIVIPAMLLIPGAIIWHAGIPIAGLVSVVLLFRRLDAQSTSPGTSLRMTH